jgi:putative transcriptional regulator
MSEFNVYEGIMQGLNEAIEFRKGQNLKARVRILSTVDPIPVAEYKPADVAKLRKDLNLSQKGLAGVIGVSPRTVESWEAGKSVPSGVATRMLYLIEADSSLVDRLVTR